MFNIFNKKNRFKRVFLVVLDSVGCGEAKDASKFNDVGAHTLKHVIEANKENSYKNLSKLGLFNLVYDYNLPTMSYYTKANEISNGKDTLTGHLEMMGINTVKPYKTFTETGFPKELIDELEKRTNRKVIGNCNASGTEIIKELGVEQMNTGSIIVYTSADSVLQIAAHEDIVPVPELYKICEIARELTLKDEWKVGRIIARPFIGSNGEFTRTANRKDFALNPPASTVLDELKKKKLSVISIGKIADIFNECGITSKIHIEDNTDGIRQIVKMVHQDFTGLCFANLNDFDSKYGHRRNPIGYGNALREVDEALPHILAHLTDDDLLIITADHGNDPTYRGTDHTREKTPVFIYSSSFKEPKRLEELDTFGSLGATIADNFNIKAPVIGKSFLDKLK
ncbi:MAG TPA: phosphopentomutase [Bacilli bacterium]|nr:phosphopentomutase [Bacilli bacterium]